MHESDAKENRIALLFCYELKPTMTRTQTAREQEQKRQKKQQQQLTNKKKEKNRYRVSSRSDLSTVLRIGISINETMQQTRSSQ